MRLKLTTFNVENLFNRYAALDAPWEERHYEQFVQALGICSVADRSGNLVNYQINGIQRNNTAQAILDVAPDILAVQEIENLYTLRNFNHEYLDNYFDRMVSIDGNDVRGIDVGVLIRAGLKVEVLGMRTHIDEPVPEKTIERTSVARFGYVVKNALFSRDALEIDIAADGKVITLIVNHLKAQDGRKESEIRRTAQATRVAELAQAAVNARRLPVVLGDLNTPPRNDGSLASLLTSPALRDPFPADTWTHFYEPKRSVSRLDYVLVHPTLTVKSCEVFKKGLSGKCKDYPGERYPTIGRAHTEASDHCPTSVVIEL